MPSFERTTSFVPSRLTTEPRTRTGSALAVAQPSAKGKTRAARMEVGILRVFGKQMHGTLLGKLTVGFFFGSHRAGGALRRDDKP